MERKSLPSGDNQRGSIATKPSMLIRICPFMSHIIVNKPRRYISTFNLLLHTLIHTLVTESKHLEPISDSPQPGDECKRQSRNPDCWAKGAEQGSCRT